MLMDNGLAFTFIEHGRDAKATPMPSATIFYARLGEFARN